MSQVKLVTLFLPFVHLLHDMHYLIMTKMYWNERPIGGKLILQTVVQASLHFVTSKESVLIFITSHILIDLHLLSTNQRFKSDTPLVENIIICSTISYSFILVRIIACYLIFNLVHLLHDLYYLRISKIYRTDRSAVREMKLQAVACDIYVYYTWR